MALTVVITYDISEDRARARVAALLQVWGDRLQRSVFLCTIDEADLDDLVGRIVSEINTDSDALHVFRQCASCWSSASAIGQANLQAETFYWAVL